jgi:hypothetical protein
MFTKMTPRVEKVQLHGVPVEMRRRFSWIYSVMKALSMFFSCWVNMERLSSGCLPSGSSYKRT